MLLAIDMSLLLAVEHILLLFAGCVLLLPVQCVILPVHPNISLMKHMLKMDSHD